MSHADQAARITDLDRLRCRARPLRSLVMEHAWRELLFLHWKFDPSLVQSRLPAGMRVDTFQDQAWVGVVPFLMRDIRPRWLPAVPGISNFHEWNVRTYVIDERGRPGVYFFSLDADQSLAVWLGRHVFHLPYLRSRLSFTAQANERRATCQRPGAAPAVIRFIPQAHPIPAVIGTLDFFLIERYLMFNVARSGEIVAGQVWHPPYEFCEVSLIQSSAAPLGWNGFDEPTRPPDHAVWSPGVDVDIFGLERVSPA